MTRADALALKVEPIIREIITTYRTPERLWARRTISARYIAGELNARGIATSSGWGVWTHKQVRSVLDALGLKLPLDGSAVEQLSPPTG